MSEETIPEITDEENDKLIKDAIILVIFRKIVEDMSNRLDERKEKLYESIKTLSKKYNYNFSQIPITLEGIKQLNIESKIAVSIEAVDDNGNVVTDQPFPKPTGRKANLTVLMNEKTIKKIKGSARKVEMKTGEQELVKTGETKDKTPIYSHEGDIIEILGLSKGTSVFKETSEKLLNFFGDPGNLTSFYQYQYVDENAENSFSNYLNRYLIMKTEEVGKELSELDEKERKKAKVAFYRMKNDSIFNSFIKLVMKDVTKSRNIKMKSIIESFKKGNLSKDSIKRFVLLYNLLGPIKYLYEAIIDRNKDLEHLFWRTQTGKPYFRITDIKE